MGHISYNEALDRGFFKITDAKNNKDKGAGGTIIEITASGNEGDTAGPITGIAKFKIPEKYIRSYLWLNTARTGMAGVNGEGQFAGPLEGLISYAIGIQENGRIDYNISLELISTTLKQYSSSLGTDEYFKGIGDILAPGSTWYYATKRTPFILNIKGIHFFGDKDEGDEWLRTGGDIYPEPIEHFLEIKKNKLIENINNPKFFFKAKAVDDQKGDWGHIDEYNITSIEDAEDNRIAFYLRPDNPGLGKTGSGYNLPVYFNNYSLSSKGKYIGTCTCTSVHYTDGKISKSEYDYNYSIQTWPHLAFSSAEVREPLQLPGYLDTNIPVFEAEEDAMSYVATGEGIEKALNYKEPTRWELLNEYVKIKKNHLCNEKLEEGTINTHYYVKHYTPYYTGYNNILDERYNIMTGIADSEYSYKYPSFYFFDEEYFSIREYDEVIEILLHCSYYSMPIKIGYSYTTYLGNDLKRYYYTGAYNNMGLIRLPPDYKTNPLIKLPGYFDTNIPIFSNIKDAEEYSKTGIGIEKALNYSNDKNYSINEELLTSIGDTFEHFCVDSTSWPGMSRKNYYTIKEMTNIIPNVPIEHLTPFGRSDFGEYNIFDSIGNINIIRNKKNNIENSYLVFNCLIIDKRNSNYFIIDTYSKDFSDKINNKNEITGIMIKPAWRQGQLINSGPIEYHYFPLFEFICVTNTTDATWIDLGVEEWYIFLNRYTKTIGQVTGIDFKGFDTDNYIMLINIDSDFLIFTDWPVYTSYSISNKIPYNRFIEDTEYDNPEYQIKKETIDNLTEALKNKLHIQTPVDPRMLPLILQCFFKF